MGSSEEEAPREAGLDSSRGLHTAELVRGSQSAAGHTVVEEEGLVVDDTLAGALDRELAHPIGVVLDWDSQAAAAHIVAEEGRFHRVVADSLGPAAGRIGIDLGVGAVLVSWIAMSASSCLVSGSWTM